MTEKPSPSKKALTGPFEEERPFPGQMAANYSPDAIANIRGNAQRVRSTQSIAQGRQLGKTVSAPVISNTFSHSNPTSPPPQSPTRAPLHSRDNSMRELQPYGDLKTAPMELDGFDIEEMGGLTPFVSPTASARKRRNADYDDAPEDEGTGMDEDDHLVSPLDSPTKTGPARNRWLGRAQTAPQIPANLSFDASF